MFFSKHPLCFFDRLAAWTYKAKIALMQKFRRLRAVELYETGMLAIRIAETLGVTRGAVSQWLKIYREHGKKALLHKKVSKKPSRLTLAQKKQLLRFLEEGAEAFGYNGQIWTQARIRALIQKKFGVTYNVNYICTLLKKLRWSWQKPICRATQRNEQEIERWRKETWPAIKKALEEGRKIIFADESAFYLLPFVGKSYAPVNAPAIVRHKLTREHLSVISGISDDGTLYANIHGTSITGSKAADFFETFDDTYPR